MRKEVINQVVILTAAPEMHLCDRAAQIIGRVVRLAPWDTESRWEEITAQEKAALEKAWREEHLPAQSYDALARENRTMEKALNEMGVVTR